MSCEPPVFAGAVHAMVADLLPPEATTPMGAPGTVSACGVTTALGAEKGLQPLALQACTTNSIAVPLVRPVMVAVFGAIPFAAGFTVKSGMVEGDPSDNKIRITKLLMAWPFGVGIQLTVAAFAVAVALTLTGTAGGPAAGGCGLTCQMAPAPLMLPCVQSEPMYTVSLARSLVSMVAPVRKQNEPPN